MDQFFKWQVSPCTCQTTSTVIIGLCRTLPIGNTLCCLQSPLFFPTKIINCCWHHMNMHLEHMQKCLAPPLSNNRFLKLNSRHTANYKVEINIQELPKDMHLCLSTPEIYNVPARKHSPRGDQIFFCCSKAFNYVPSLSLICDLSVENSSRIMSSFLSSLLSANVH